MQLYWQAYNGDTTQTIYQGDALEVLRSLPSESVHCCITSPPYWGLRDYGVAGQLGLEPTPEEYVAKMVEVFAEVRRVLRDDGTLWLNLGDSYAKSKSNNGGYSDKSTLAGFSRPDTKGRQANESGTKIKLTCAGLKPKDLIGIPWRVAFALQADGWYLRSDIIWAKPNPMPESVTDRPTRAHEYVFLLAKAKRYFYDADAIREPHTSSVDPSKLVGWQEARRGAGASEKVGDASSYANGRDRTRTLRQPTGGKVYLGNPVGRNKRSVWTVSTKPFPEAHFAVYPPDLIEPCILAGTSPTACPHCGAPWKRVVERERTGEREVQASDRKGLFRNDLAKHAGRIGEVKVTTLGWEPTCTCEGNDGSGRCVVLDPFVGSGTTLLVAQRLGRSGIGIELNPDYCTMASRRIDREQCR